MLVTRRTRVYIAGPYSKGGPEENTKIAQEVWNRLWLAGYTPFCPHWSHYQHILLPLPYEDWLMFDLEWLQFCDYLLRLPGESSGAGKEVEVARSINMPVFFSVNDLLTNPLYSNRQHVKG